jgi:hypothetical protein
MKPSEHFRKSSIEVEPGFCFVLMPFGVEMDSIYTSGIKPAIEAQAMRCKRADEHFTSDEIMVQVLDDILRAEIVVADLSSHNPNVFYELGLAHAIKDNVILLTQPTEGLPFDISGFRHFPYQNTMAGATLLRSQLERAIAEIRETSTAHRRQIQDVRRAVERGFQSWTSIGDLVISDNDFADVVMLLAELALDDRRMAFVACVAAYKGRHLTPIMRSAQGREEVISALVRMVAYGPEQRPAWRAAAMLETCDREILSRKTSAAVASGELLDDERRRLLTDIISSGVTRSYLESLKNDPNLPGDSRSKAAEALRQIQAKPKSHEPAQVEAGKGVAKD